MNNYYPFTNTPLPYAYDALEPYIDAKTMELHHDKHLQTYIDNLNNTLSNLPKLQKVPLEKMLAYENDLPESVQQSIRNNGGGVYNHRFFFDLLANPVPQAPIGLLAKYIDHFFGNFMEFQKQFTKAALSVFGSGYAWLVSDVSGALKIVTTANQDTPLSQDLRPILNLDVWEHAYYLKHYNVRADYIKDWFSIINWNHVNQNFLNCMNEYL